MRECVCVCCHPRVIPRVCIFCARHHACVHACPQCLLCILSVQVEKEKGQFLLQQMAEKEEIIRMLRADVSEVIETPIEVLRQTISNMLQGKRSDEEDKQV